MQTGARSTKAKGNTVKLDVSAANKEVPGYGSFSQFVQDRTDNEALKTRLELNQSKVEEEMQQQRERLAKKQKEEKKLPKVIKQTMNVTELWNKAYKIDLLEAKKKISARPMAKAASSKMLPLIAKKSKGSNLQNKAEYDRTMPDFQKKTNNKGLLFSNKSQANLHTKGNQPRALTEVTDYPEFSMPIGKHSHVLFDDIRVFTEPNSTQFDLVNKINHNFKLEGNMVEDYPDEEASFLDPYDSPAKSKKAEALTRRHPKIQYHKKSQLEVPLDYSGNKISSSQFVSRFSRSKHSSILWEEGRQNTRESEVVGSIMGECDTALVLKHSRLNRFNHNTKDARITHKMVDMLKATMDHKRHLQEIGSYLL